MGGGHTHNMGAVGASHPAAPPHRISGNAASDKNIKDGVCAQIEKNFARAKWKVGGGRGAGAKPSLLLPLVFWGGGGGS